MRKHKYKSGTWVVLKHIYPLHWFMISAPMGWGDLDKEPRYEIVDVLSASSVPSVPESALIIPNMMFVWHRLNGVDFNKLTEYK